MDPPPNRQPDEGPQPRAPHTPPPAFTGEGVADLASLMRSSQDQLERARRNMESQFERLQEQGLAIKERDQRIAELEETLTSLMDASQARTPESGAGAREAAEQVVPAAGPTETNDEQVRALRDDRAEASGESPPAAAATDTGLQLATRVWRQYGEAAEDLWFGPRLQEALEIQDRGDTTLSADELEFLRASQIFDEYTRVRMHEADLAAHRSPPGRTLNLALAALVALVIIEQIGIIIYLTR